jgi:hypothetical protein
MYLTDLHVWAINARCQGRAANAWWFLLIASMVAVHSHCFPPTHAGTQLLLAQALEAKLADIDPEVSDWMCRQWPHERRWAILGCPHTEGLLPAVAEVVATYRCALQWKRWAAAETDSALQTQLTEGGECWTALGECQLQLLEYHAQKEQQGGIVSVGTEKFLEARVLGQEKAVEAAEMGLRALRSGKQHAHFLCRKVTADLGVLTTSKWLVYQTFHADAIALQCAERAVKEILTCADHYLRAVAAEVAGRRVLASTWRSAAQLRDRAIDRRGIIDFKQMLKHSAHEDLQRADALAEKALKLETGAVRKS